MPIKSILHSNAQDFFACDKIVIFICHTNLSCHTKHSLCHTDLFFCYTDKFVILSASEVSIKNGEWIAEFMNFFLWLRLATRWVACFIRLKCQKICQKCLKIHPTLILDEVFIR